MKPETREWVNKAEDDFDVACQVRRRRKSPKWNILSFLCQQTLEKYLQAKLVEEGLRFPKTHDLKALLDLVLPTEPLWAGYAAALMTLANYAVAPRYSGYDLDKQMGIESMRICREIRKVIRSNLGLSGK